MMEGGEEGRRRGGEVHFFENRFLGKRHAIGTSSGRKREIVIKTACM